jgi:ABC-type branched-subunit amino acid transport system substrate-binding protein
MRFLLVRLAAATSAAVLCAFGFAAEIVVGQVAPLTPADSPGNQLRTGVQLYFDSVNEAGGIHGAKLRLVALLGTGAMEELVGSGVLNEHGIPVVGMRSGALSLHNPPHPYLFHTRASYDAELEKITTQLATNGLNRLAVLHEDSVFGRVALGQLKETLASRPTMSVAAAATAEFYKAFRGQGSAAPVFALSLVDAGEVAAKIGKPAAKGLVVAQVVPDPANDAIPIIKELRRNFNKYAKPPMQATQAVVEGYLAAKVLVEALRRAGPNPSRKKLVAALESMRSFDAGGIVIGFSAQSHAGSKYVDLAIMLGSGRLMR